MNSQYYHQPRVASPLLAPLQRASWPRIFNAVAGIWLFISAFAWLHTATARTNSWVVGLLMTGAALWAMRTPAVRWFNTVLAVWLGLSTTTMPNIHAFTLWNNTLVAIAAFMLSLIPDPGQRPGR